MGKQISITAVQVLRNKLYDQKAEVELRIQQRELDYASYMMNYERARQEDMELLYRTEGGISAVERLNDAALAYVEPVEEYDVAH